MVVFVSQRARLLHCPGRAAYEILVLLLHPEVRRIIGEIGQDGHIRHVWQRRAQAVVHGAVKVGTSETTMSGFDSNQCRERSFVVDPWYKRITPCMNIKPAPTRASSPSPASGCRYLRDVCRSVYERHRANEALLQIDEADVPGPVLLFDDGFSASRSAWPPPRRSR